MHSNNTISKKLTYTACYFNAVIFKYTILLLNIVNYDSIAKLMPLISRLCYIIFNKLRMFVALIPKVHDTN